MSSGNGSNEDAAATAAAAADAVLPPTPSSTTSSTATMSPTELTPLRAHYLKKSLVELQFGRELDAMTSSARAVPAIAFLGPPFAPPPRGAPVLALPLLRYAFRECVLTFPFLAAAPAAFWPDKLQPFLASVFARGISADGAGADVLAVDAGVDGADVDEATRQKLRHKLERALALFMGGAIRLAEPEETVRLHQADLDRLEALARRRQRKQRGGTFEVNVVCVRTVVEKGRIRKKAHEEFIIRTRQSGQEDVYVSRRYGDFATLAAELRKAHPDTAVPPPPSKDRSQVATSSSSSSAAPPLERTGSVSSVLSTDSDGRPAGGSGARLAREKNRLTLRAFLHALMASGTLASSPVLRSFLLAGPTALSADERADARRREEADRLRDDGRKRFAREIADRVDSLRGALRHVKGDMMGKDGLTRVFATIKTVQDVRQLPEDYKAVLEWARVSLASTIFQNLVAADDASDTFAALKRIHGLMPYFMLKTALRISNPVGMIRGVLDLFMAQPFGQKSLLQRMFSSSLQEEVHALEEDIAAVADKIDDPVIVDKVRRFVYAPKETQAAARAEAKRENISVLAVVLRSSDAPALNRQQLQMVIRCHRAYVMYQRQRQRMHDSDDDDGPEDEDAWLFEDLSVLTKLYARLRDRQQIIELIFEGTTADLLKDIITIFYAPLAQVYKAASISDSIGDLQTFITDLIRTVEQVDASTQADPARTVKIFVDLVQRHEQAFYSFVHKVHSKGESLFDGLMRWIERFLTLHREGLTPEPLPLEFLLPHAGTERAQILAEVDAVARYHYKLKVAYEERVRRRFGRARAERQGASEADAEDAAAQALVNGVVDELSFGDLMKGDAADAAAEDSASDESDESESESETDSEDGYETAEEGGAHRAPALQEPPQPLPRERRKSAVHRARSSTFSQPPTCLKEVPPVPQSANIQTSFSQQPGRASLSLAHDLAPPSTPKSPGRASQDRGRVSLGSRPQRRKRKQEEIKHPELEHIPTLLPVFLELLRPGLEPRRQAR